MSKVISERSVYIAPKPHYRAGALDGLAVPSRTGDQRTAHRAPALISTNVKSYIGQVNK